jgi:hypothetical protein
LEAITPTEWLRLPPKKEAKMKRYKYRLDSFFVDWQIEAAAAAVGLKLEEDCGGYYVIVTKKAIERYHRLGGVWDGEKLNIAKSCERGLAIFAADIAEQEKENGQQLTLAL